jgi:stage VI sporulation protein D
MKGGVALSQENQSFLRFSLEESLWFRKGQEVEELVSISLDPDITIQESDQYVTIRGSLVLTGEYKCQDADAAHPEDSYTSQKFVESVETREEGNCEFSHRFPVDITIPNNRVQSIYDIDVLVDSFDYSLPERSCLKLSAELTISGLYETERQQEQEEQPELEALHRSGSEDEDFEPVQIPTFQPYVGQNNFQDHFLFEAEARRQEPEEIPEEYPQYPNFTFQPQFQPAYPQENPWYAQEARNEGSQPAKVEEEFVVVQQHEEVELSEESSSSSSSSSEEKPKNKKGLKGLFKKQKTMTLTEFFARKDENAEQAKLKMCIVQKGDTVDSLADRYAVSVQNLLRVNRLELNQDVYEGQVLYIPATFEKSKK